MKKIPKKEAKKQIEFFFKNLKDKSAKDVKKIKKLAMSHNISLKSKRKLFCKKCLIPFNEPKIRIKKGMKTIKCENCGFVNRWKIK